MGVLYFAKCRKKRGDLARYRVYISPNVTKRESWRDIRRLFFCQADLVGVNGKDMRHPVFEGIVFQLVTDGKVKADGVIVGLHPVRHNLIDRAPEFIPGIIGPDFESADDKPGQPVEFAGTLKVPEHAIDAVQIFPGVFHEQDLPGSIDIRYGAGEAFDGLEVAADQLTFGRSCPVLLLRLGGILHFLSGERLANGKDRGHLDGFGL